MILYVTLPFLTIHLIPIDPPLPSPAGFPGTGRRPGPAGYHDLPVARWTSLPLAAEL